MRRIVFIAGLLLAPSLFAVQGIVQTLDGKKLEGQIALESGAVTVSGTNGSVEKVTFATLASLKMAPPLDLSTAPAQGNGTGLIGSYFNSTDLSGPSVSRLDETVDFTWGPVAPMPVINRVFFSARWLGEIEAPVSGEYTFYLQAADGGRLWVDTKLLVDRWNSPEKAEGMGKVQLEGGKKYQLRMEHFKQTGNAVARLLWTGPGIAKSVVPKGRLYAASGAAGNLVAERRGAGGGVAANLQQGQGLLGVYFTNADFAGRHVTRLDSTINFDWGESRPMQGIGEKTFSVRWLGQVRPQFDEHYTFHTETAGYVRLWIDGRPVINQWRSEPATLASVPAQLKGGAKYDLRMEISKTGESATARLFWSSPSTPRTIVPQEALFPADASTVRLAAGDSGQDQGSGLAKGVRLTSGSLIAAPIQTADENKVSFRVNERDFTVSTINVACIGFQNVSAEVASRFQGRRGVLFANRDFVDGDFKAVQSGKVKLSSVLFGFQTYDLGTRVAAVLLRDVASAPWRYVVKARDGSEFLVTAMRIERDQIVFEDAPLRGYQVLTSQLSELKIRSETGSAP